MHFGPVVRGVCALLFAGSVGALVLVSARYRGSDASALKTFLTLAVLILGAGTVELFGVSHRLVPGGIERVAPMRKRLVIHWPDVVAIEWSPVLRWYEVTAGDGERVRVYQQLTGIPAFARAVLEGVPAAVIDARPGLRGQLENASRGVSPPAEVERDEWRTP